MSHRFRVCCKQSGALTLVTFLAEDNGPASMNFRASHFSTVTRSVFATNDPLRVERSFHNHRNIASILPGWRSLADDCAIQPFLNPDWQLTWLRQFEPAANLSCWTVRRSGQMIAMLPLVSERIRLFGVPVRRLRPAGALKTPDRFDILTRESVQAEAVPALWADLKSRCDWDVIELVDLPEFGPGRNLLDLARAQGFQVDHRISRQSPYLRIPASTSSIDDILGATTAKFRANLRRRRRNLEKTGEVRLTRITEFDEAAFTRFLDLEHSGWKGQNQTSILSDPRTTRYYRELARSAASLGLLSFYALECAGVPVAMHFGVTSHGRYSVPKLAYSEAFNEYAPGHLLIYAILEDLIERDCCEFDFLGDQTPWKQEWTNDVRTHFRAHIFNKTIAGRAANAVRYGILPVVSRASRRTMALSGLIPSALFAIKASS